jgi:LysM repeat protein
MRRFLLSSLVIAVAITMFAVTPASAQGGEYVVQPGDTLFSIAARFNVSVSDLATINGMYDVNAVYVGQVLRLPASQSSSVPVSQPVSVPQVQPVVSYAPGTTVTTVTSYTAYTVRPGDTLSAIAQRFNTTPQAILSANAVANPNLVYVGQYLVIPRTRTTVVPAPRTATLRGRVYIVRPGDNLFGIASYYRRNAWDIARANGILDLNSIYVGQALVIP